MYRFIYIILFCFITFSIDAKSPHGEKFNVDCATCHVTQNWTTIKKGYDHNKTKFPLTGQHKNVDCMKCHVSLEFSTAKSKCYECHADVHQGTTGRDCERCHNTSSWIVTRIQSIHQEAGFPLRGEHQTADCNRCHTSASKLQFNNIRTDCYACHKTDYYGTAGKPYDHAVLGFDTDCAHCHNMTGTEWNSIGKGFDHSFFPLVGGHNLSCNECHINGDYRVKLSTDCTSCHSGKKAEATALNPAHTSLFSKYSCAECHTTQTWDNVKFKQHDAFYKIYSGHHKNAWTKCTDCHVNDAGFDATNTCSRCHNDIQHL
ncbi:MAG: hypothetical protein PHS59_03685 [Paludibacter sp.]|nr:hypothetical protein [Paludibacter sp.]